MTDLVQAITLFHNRHVRLASCSKEGQSSTRRGAFAFDGASAGGEGALKGRAVGHRPFFCQDEHGVWYVFDLQRTGHAGKLNCKSPVPSHRKHFEFPCLTGAMNADCPLLVPCQSDEIFRRRAA